MTRRTFASPMPSKPIRQKHGDPHTEDNYGFWASLSTLAGVDINVQVVPNDPEHLDQAHGVTIFCLHGRTAASNGYHHIIRADGKVHPMTHAELHQDLSKWSAAEVRRWRRGQTKKSANPVTLRGALRYLRRHGGTGVIELKSPVFKLWWIAAQAVKVCRLEDAPPYFKALSNMRFCEEKCAVIQEAGGHFAIIFGNHVRGRLARVIRARIITARWAVKPTATW